MPSKTGKHTIAGGRHPGLSHRFLSVAEFPMPIKTSIKAGGISMTGADVAGP